MSADGGTSQGTFGEVIPDDRFSFNIPNNFLCIPPTSGDLSGLFPSNDNPFE
jgi:hypothetical protein